MVFTGDLNKFMMGGVLRYHHIGLRRLCNKMTNLSVKTMLHKANCIDCSLTTFHAAGVIGAGSELDPVGKAPPHVWGS